eukprot:CAMPEP_0204376746 /NCGR_PEP_ID=MMETSP0469-20131031/50352_1 /ASSEMBLY_ACC=CAM_ASM_000384 /TAXON_ID=2969 /ORGANISM="Oxyrrhis marina" /LENGTH=53 /DNA_ID=CAMNT_0051367677 /DNA_START=33 /DNA_END=191 /DNA_ORIENTATION=+
MNGRHALGAAPFFVSAVSAIPDSELAAELQPQQATCPLAARAQLWQGPKASCT